MESATLPRRDCGWCAEPIPADTLRCLRCGELPACATHPLELISGRCTGCGQPGCRRCLVAGPRCRDCPAPEEAAAGEDAAGEDAAGDVSAASDAKPLDLTDPIGAARYATEGDDWLGKHVVGAVLFAFCWLLIPLYLLLGYQVRIAKQQHADPGRDGLPGFDGLGGLFLSGAKHALALSLPVLVSIVALASPIVVFALVGGRAGAQAGVLWGLVLWVWVVVLSLAYPLVMPAIELRYLRTQSVWAGFDVRGLWEEMAGRPTDYVMLSLYYWVLGSLGLLGGVACGVGVVATMPWGIYACGCLLGRYMALQDRRVAEEQALVETLLAEDPTRLSGPSAPPASPGS